MVIGNQSIEPEAMAPTLFPQQFSPRYTRTFALQKTSLTFSMEFQKKAIRTGMESVSSWARKEESFHRPFSAGTISFSEEFGKDCQEGRDSLSPRGSQAQIPQTIAQTSPTFHEECPPFWGQPTRRPSNDKGCHRQPHIMIEMDRDGCFLPHGSRHWPHS